MARLDKAPSPGCIFCNDQDDNTVHLIVCPQGSEITAPLTRCLTEHVASITPQDVTLLNIPTSECMELPVVWMVSTCLMMVWEERVLGRVARLASCKAELYARLQVLKQTKWKNYTLQNSAVLLEEMLNLHFC